jgi:hypothetical protein
MQTTATLNPILTTIANQFMSDPKGFVAAEIFPEFDAPTQSGLYYMFAPGDIVNVPKLNPRAPGAPYQRLQTKISNDNYACENYGLEAPAPDEERKKYASYFDLDKLKTNRIVDTIRINRELRVASLVQGAGVTTAAIAIPWNDPSSNPKGDVDAAKETIRRASGMRGASLKLVISEPTFLTLQYHPKLVDLFKFTTPGLLNEDKLASYLGIAEVVVAYNIQATNNEGQAFTAADIWGNMALLCAVNAEQDLEVPTFGRTFKWTAFQTDVSVNTGGTGPAMTAAGGGPDLMQIFTYRDETVKSDVHRADQYLTEKLVAPGAGFLLTGCLR